MDNDQINYLRHRLERYEESITETEDHFGELESFGRYRASAPCYEKNGIPHLIEALNADAEGCDTFWQEYDRITGKLKTFETLKGHFYRDLLYEDLKNYVSAYHSALCYADLNMITVNDHDLFNREVIRALLAELHEDYDTRDIEILVTVLDESFSQMKRPFDETSSNKSQEPERSGYPPHIARERPFFIYGENNQTRSV
ncbi:MAG: hypothetical protein Q7T80_15190 [Methanoregula sp.]|nr:hypothetical protein [Methanoregula sp.]